MIENSRIRTAAFPGTHYCYVKRTLGWMNIGMVDDDNRAFFTKHFLTVPDRQYGPAQGVAYVPYCDPRGRFLSAWSISTDSVETIYPS